MTHPKTPKFEYNKITKYIYLGTNQCCVAHFKKGLLSKNIKADISLEEERLDSPYGAKYFLWLPVKDRKAPTQEQLNIGVDFIQSLMNNKVKMYVHCKNGHGRSPTLIAAYLISNGIGVDESIKFIKKKRKTIHLTKLQKDALRKFKKRLR